MDLGYTQFQSLSACEAKQLQKEIGEIILSAYQSGLNVVIANYEKPIENLVSAHRQAMVDLGFKDSDTLPNILVSVLRDNVKDDA